MTRLPAAVLWDMDGLLVDTEPTWTVAEVELAERLGGTWSDALKAQIVGTRLEVAVPTILRWYDVADDPATVSATSRWLLARMVELYAAPISMRSGATQLLAQLAEQQIPTALVSSSYRVLVDAVLAHGMGPFALTLAGDEVKRGKPDPEPYQSACSRLGADPRDCVVLEDSPAGVESGLAAGCAVVAVPSVPGVVFADHPRLRVVPSLDEVDAALLGALIA